MSAYRLINFWMNRLLRSPWHGFVSKRIMIVNYTGRKSGKSYSVPVSYYHDGEVIYCFTNGSWRHNFTAEASASLRIRGRDYPVVGSIVYGGHEQQVDVMSAYFKAVPQDRKFYGVHRGSDGEPIREEVEKALGRIDIIRFEFQTGE